MALLYTSLWSQTDSSAGVQHQFRSPSKLGVQENVLLDKEGHVKVTDFGLAKGNMNADGRTNSFIGTMEYMCAPSSKLGQSRSSHAAAL